MDSRRDLATIVVRHLASSCPVALVGHGNDRRAGECSGLVLLVPGPLRAMRVGDDAGHLKVHEAASFGLPIVATDLLRGQLGWNDGIDLLAADSADAGRFADLVVMLHRDQALWHRLRDNALRRLRAENAGEQFAAAVRAVLEAR